MDIILALLIVLIEVSLFSAFGMSLMPKRMGKDSEDDEKIVTFLLAPVLGFAVWIGLTCCLGMILPYNRIFLFVLLCIVAAFIFLRRKCLYFPKNGAVIWLFIAVLFASAIVLYGVLPLSTNEGIYFSKSAADNARVCVVNAIINEGLPPKNPFLTFDGEIIPAYYHFGCVAYAAQAPILFGVDSIISNSVVNGLSVFMCMLACAAISYKCSHKVNSWIFVWILVMMGSPQMLLEMILPATWQQVLYPNEAFAGFFCLFSEFTFSPHCILAVAIIMCVIYLYVELIQTDNKQIQYWLSILIGAAVAGACFLSIYGGAFFAVILAIAVAINYCLNSNIRRSVNKTLIQHIIMVVVAGILSIGYVVYLMARMESGDGGIAFGVLPVYGQLSGFGILGAVLDFYLFLLPSNEGICILFALLMIFLPKLMPNDTLVKLMRTICALILVSIFFVHSTVLTNDYGWRMIDVPYILGAVFGACLLSRLFSYLYNRKKIYGYMVIISCIVISCLNIQTIADQIIHVDHPGDSNETLKEAIKGWEVVQEYTDTDDIVMSNPEAFADVSLRDASNDYQGVNYFSAYYSKRFIVINDLLTTKTSFIGPQSVDRIDELYARMVRIFSGNPTASDVEFLADEQMVKALLVLPTDGLWNSEGALTEKYECVEEDSNYKVYILME